jgi:uncharacterized membrane protein
MKLKEILTSAVIMLVLDFVYLGSFKNFFQSVFKNIQGQKINLRITGAIICYVIMLIGLNYFIISKKASLKDAFFLGFLVYLVYDSTNYATFTKWPFKMLMLDSVWGGILFTLTTFGTYKLLKINAK